MKKLLILFMCFIAINMMGQGTIKRDKKESAKKEQSSRTGRKSTKQTTANKRKSSSNNSLSQTNSNGKSVIDKLLNSFVYVKGGTFTMGATSEQDKDADDDEKPAHQVTIDSYYIAKHEVTQALWKTVMGSNPSMIEGENLPVESVSWSDCIDFIEKLNNLTGKKFRLPTEAEWEYAARGGNKSRDYKFSGSNNVEEVAWFSGNSDGRIHPVGTKKANELGLYDMSGNVWEWCEDLKDKYKSNSQTNPKGGESGYSRVNRGGSWGDHAKSCRVSSRFNNSFEDHTMNLGFRLVISKL